MKGVAVVIPAHNEGLRALLVAQEAAMYAEFVIVVDDGSYDDTWHCLRDAVCPIYPLRHAVNMGKAAALKTGCAAAIRLGAEVIVMMDGDGQHPPRYIPEMMAFMAHNHLDFVFTERTGVSRMPIVRRAGNYAINKAAFFLYGLKTNDLWCGFRAVRAACLPRISWRARDYSGEVQMALAVGSSGMKYAAYPIPTVYEEGVVKGVHILHGIKLLFEMALWRIMA